MPAVRLAALAAAALACSLVAPAAAHGGHKHPVPKPQVVDPSGDVRVAGAGADIVSALFATEGTTSKVRGKHVYTPTKLIVTLTYAGAVATDPYVAHVVLFEAPGCGEVYLEVFADGGTWGLIECDDEYDFEFAAKVKGSTLTLSVPFGLVGKAYLKPGAVLSGLVAYTAPADPEAGIEPNELVRPIGVALVGDPNAIDAGFDLATSTATFRIG